MEAHSSKRAAETPDVVAEYARRCAPPSAKLAELAKAAELYPPKTTRHYLSLIDWSRPDGDPILAQCLPDARELESGGLPEDGLGELPQSPLPRAVRRYEDRALLIATDRCFMRCRFCFRKRLWRKGAPETGAIESQELAAFCDYLRRTPALKDVLISGGDPLTLSDAKLMEIIDAIAATGGIDTIRVCTRAPAVEPSRVTAKLAELLGSRPGVWFVTHFNHPREFGKEAAEACGRLVSHGVPVLNQTVLLKGVNDDATTLSSLFRTLAKHRVRPHYLFHADPVRGTAHFATGIKKGLAIMKELRGCLSSIATPCFALDLPKGGGKVPLLPDYSDGQGGYFALDGRRLKHPLT